MKSLHAFTLLIISAAAAAAQTNTFPASGNVGIGTTSPSYKLSVKGSGVSSGLAFGITNSSDTAIVTVLDSGYTRIQNQKGGPDLQLGVTGGLNQVFGLYTSAPDNSLNSYYAVGSSAWTGNNGDVVLLPRANADFIVMTGAASERMRILSGGNVGIGTASPTAKLDVNGGISSTLSDGSSYSLLQAKNDVSAVLQTITFGSTKTGTTFGLNNANLAAIYTTAAISQVPTALAIGTYGGLSPLVFGTNGTERMRVDQNGNVGIGTTNPYTRLEVRGGPIFSGVKLDNQIALNSNGADFGFVLNSDSGKWSLGYGQDLSINGTPALTWCSGGNVGIGTTNPTEKLSVNGRIRAKEIVVETTGWPDYVFTKDYKLASLSEVEQHIQQQGHLPGVPSAAEVAEKGVSVGDMQAVLLAKIEELTLHQIAQEKELTALRTEVKLLRQAQ